MTVCSLGKDWSTKHKDSLYRTIFFYNRLSLADEEKMYSRLIMHPLGHFDTNEEVLWMSKRFSARMKLSPSGGENLNSNQIHFVSTSGSRPWIKVRSLRQKRFLGFLRRVIIRQRDNVKFRSVQSLTFFEFQRREINQVPDVYLGRNSWPFGWKTFFGNPFVWEFFEQWGRKNRLKPWDRHEISAFNFRFPQSISEVGVKNGRKLRFSLGNRGGNFTPSLTFSAKSSCQ